MGCGGVLESIFNHYRTMGNKELLARITVVEREVEQLNSRLAKLEKK